MRSPVRATIVLVALLLVPGGGGAEQACYAECSGDLAGLADLGLKPGERAAFHSVLRFDPVTGAMQPTTVAELAHSRPVILAFGSYT